ncbi:hypothetical protein [Rickettsiales endosymbiont of Trichoplax sp. H2]|uniref:hypothetical protein n=1 Tax=Rickettsiales endosymbiont of Trichoplax sp. H2 TaxID=2021221 RepID=UPI0012B1C5C1|nr:hypothetical protein [Rickettsiales endosymbiont of Trichoplax sp. H2]MSO13215.1 hypothetical protein [Rickettsiales endosymbiont of Trichoplax sp. H2]
MPGMTNEEFDQEYLRIIAKIALKATQNNDIDIIDEYEPVILDFNIEDESIYEEEIAELQALKQRSLEDDIDFSDVDYDLHDYIFELNNNLINDAEEKGIFQFFVQDIFDVNKNEPYEGAKESRLDELSIPQNVKDELKAMAYVATFEELRKNADNKDAFLHFVGILEKMSDGVKSLEVENPEIMGELNRASGILQNVEYAFSNLTEVEKRDLLGGNSRSIIFDKAEEAYNLQQVLKKELVKYLVNNNVNIFDHKGDLIEGINLPNYIKFNAKDELNGFLPGQFEDVRNQEGLVKVKDFLGALGIDDKNIGQFKDQVQKEKDRYTREIISRNESRRMNKLQSANAKEQLAVKILKVAGISEGQIARIMQNPKAKSAIIKRSEQAFENLGIDLEQLNIIGVEEALKEIDNQALQAELEKQSKELIAQIGRVDSRSLDGQDMRGKE